MYFYFFLLSLIPHSRCSINASPHIFLFSSSSSLHSLGLVPLATPLRCCLICLVARAHPVPVPLLREGFWERFSGLMQRAPLLTPNLSISPPFPFSWVTLHCLFALFNQKIHKHCSTDDMWVFPLDATVFQPTLGKAAPQMEGGVHNICSYTICNERMGFSAPF